VTKRATERHELVKDRSAGDPAGGVGWARSDAMNETDLFFEDSDHLNIYFEGKTVVAEPMDLWEADTAVMDIQDRLLAILAQLDCPRIVLDLTMVSMEASTSFLGMMIMLRKRIAEKSGQMALCGIRHPLMETLEITRLHEVFQIFPTRQEAIDALE
jgi:anti-anti-sigma factor